MYRHSTLRPLAKTSKLLLDSFVNHWVFPALSNQMIRGGTLTLARLASSKACEIFCEHVSRCFKQKYEQGAICCNKSHWCSEPFWNAELFCFEFCQIKSNKDKPCSSNLRDSHITVQRQRRWWLRSRGTTYRAPFGFMVIILIHIVSNHLTLIDPWHISLLHPIHDNDMGLSEHEMRYRQTCNFWGSDKPKRKHPGLKLKAFRRIDDVC